MIIVTYPLDKRKLFLTGIQNPDKPVFNMFVVFFLLWIYINLL